MTSTFTSVITKEGKWFVAHCAELGVVSQGKTLDEAQKNLKEAVELYLEDQPKKSRFVANQAPLISVFEVRHG